MLTNDIEVTIQLQDREESRIVPELKSIVRSGPYFIFIIDRYASIKWKRRPTAPVWMWGKNDQFLNDIKAAIHYANLQAFIRLKSVKLNGLFQHQMMPERCVSLVYYKSMRFIIELLLPEIKICIEEIIQSNITNDITFPRK